MTTDNSREIEEHEMTPFESQLAQAILGALEYRGFYDCGKYLDTSFIEHIRPLLHQELLKARETWLRDEIVKLEGMKNFTMGTFTAEAWNHALQTIIDRYQSELDQPNK